MQARAASISRLCSLLPGCAIALYKGSAGGGGGICWMLLSPPCVVFQVADSACRPAGRAYIAGLVAWIWVSIRTL